MKKRKSTAGVVMRLWLAGGLLAGISPVYSQAAEDTLTAQKTPPVAVVFGVRSLAPETPVSNQQAFVSQEVTLPDVACAACEASSTHWESAWVVSGADAMKTESRPDTGWYVFSSGLKGIGVGIQTSLKDKARRRSTGNGNHLENPGDMTVGLLRLEQNTGAGLVALPPAQFKRITTFYDAAGHEVYAQEDTVQVSADLTVPTCTSTSESLSFPMPDISQVWLKRNVQAGHYTDTLMSPPQLVVANCSENTQTLRIRFIPQGSVTDSTDGHDTILVGRDDVSGQDTGTGYLMKYDAQAFGQRRVGVVQWNRQSPLVLTNPHPSATGDELTQGITVSLQAYYARAQNNLDVTAGNITAKGIYQVSYD